MIEGDKFMEAARMRRQRFKNSGACLWKFQWVLSMSEAQSVYNGSFNIAFFNSFYYQRKKKYWEAIIQRRK